jgi:hypothetical protein
MAKRAISVTLERDNLVWLSGRARAASRSISETLDGLIAAARRSGVAGVTHSVVGTVEIAADDPDLSGADAVVRSLVGASLAREKASHGWRRPHRRRPRG